MTKEGLDWDALVNMYKSPGVDDCVLGEVLHPNHISNMFLEDMFVEPYRRSSSHALPKQFGSVKGLQKKETNTKQHIYIYIYTYAELQEKLIRQRGGCSS